MPASHRKITITDVGVMLVAATTVFTVCRVYEETLAAWARGWRPIRALLVKPQLRRSFQQLNRRIGPELLLDGGLMVRDRL